MKLPSSRSGLIAASLLSGILLFLGWPARGFAPLLFIALIPLLYVEDFYFRERPKKSGRKIFLYSYITYVTFNILTTWWVKYATFFGAVAAITCNALFMAIVFLLFHLTRKKLRGMHVGWGYAALICYWITFELLHMDWDLSWPWLTLGNGFAGWPLMIQWYEFTGALGGTAWIWKVNILIYLFLASRILKTQPVVSRSLAWIAVVILVPIIYSVVRYYTYEESQVPVNVAVIQPNIDPYNEKFSGMSSSDQLQRILTLAAQVTDSTTDYIVAPETALPDGIWEEELEHHPHIRRLMEFQENFPEASWVIGLASNRFYPDSNLRTSTARKFTQAEGYYDSFNTAMQLEPGGKISLHHKSKLVPGVEKMPFPVIFRHLEKFAIDLGGTSGSLGVQDVPVVFDGKEAKSVVAPAVCYESIYGDYLSHDIRLGAKLIFIITNDGWWSDTPGYRQHLDYGTLRAIEFRRSIARSANTGISCFINQRGDILQPTKWWTPDAIKSTVNANSTLTLYARTGDLIGKIAIAGTFLFLVLMVFRSLKKRV